MRREPPRIGGTLTFTLGRSHVLAPLICAWGALACAPLLLGAAYLLYGAREPVIAGLCVLGAAICGFIGWRGLRVSYRLPLSSIALDQTGLWPAHLPREQALIRWEHVHAFREAVQAQQLHLLNAEGQVLMRLDRQLAGFAALRALVVERVAARAFPTDPTSIGRKAWHHALWIAVITGLCVLGFYLGFAVAAAAGGVALLLAAFLAHAYLTMVHRVELLPDAVRVAYPTRTLEIARAKVTGAVLAEEDGRIGMKFPMVMLLVAQKKPIPLRNFDVEPATLHQIIERWRCGP